MTCNLNTTIVNVINKQAVVMGYAGDEVQLININNNAVTVINKKGERFTIIPKLINR